MREILFRGKRLDNDEWVHGYLVRHPSAVQIGDYSNPWYIHVPPRDPDDSGGVYNVSYATIGQYIGLTDTNGKKIFEGDIVRYIYEPGEGFWNVNQLSVVVWEHTGFRLDGIIGTNKFALLTGWLVSVPCNKNFFEVIGNVHDTPDLLEKKEASNAPPN